ncbi:hypothetical protein [Actinosynnema sp. NPDC020468]|uniref:hypothetical protein n=1 Tax=Actinosynnema sp. NPDC020468 TaxID=3154488 RepID=UPI0033D6B51C
MSRPAGVRVVVVANVEPGAGKSAAARALHDALRGYASEVVLWDCSGTLPPPPLHTILPREGVVVVDTGSEPGSSSWKWGARVADRLVIPVPVDRQAARSAALMIQWMAAHGFGRLVGDAITVTERHRRRDRVLAGLIGSHFGKYTSEVAVAPEAWPAVAATILNGFADRAPRNIAVPLDRT